MGARAAATLKRTRIQQENEERILEAALEAFSRNGFPGTTLDQIASAAGMSKPNLLYYFDGKRGIYVTLLSRLLDTWLEPLRAIDPRGVPEEEIRGYIRRKMTMAREFPRQSRLFANEIIQGAPHIREILEGTLVGLIDEKTGVIRDWIRQGRLADHDPRLLIFAVWATTQHYSDFDTQVRIVLGAGPGDDSHFDRADRFLCDLFIDGLRPR